MITNADTGIVLTIDHYGDDDDGPHMAVVTGTSVTLMNGPEIPGQYAAVVPALQREDGSFVGTAWVGEEDVPYMVAFDQTGAVLWSVPNEEPKIATADGGVIGLSGITYDQNGSATGQVGALPTYSWKGAYQIGSIDSLLPAFGLAYIAATYAAVPGGNLTGNGFSLVHHTFGLVFCGPAPGDGGCPSGTTNVSFSYLPGIDGTNYAQAIDFSQTYPAWVTTIKSQAYNRYKAAFEHLPAIVSAKVSASPLYGGTTSVKTFEHTTFVWGDWPADGRTDVTPYAVGRPVQSWVYYLSIMGNAQWALGNYSGQPTPLSPPYVSPPMTDQLVKAQFDQLMRAIGNAIGNVAAHETGHQLQVPGMDSDREPPNATAACEAIDVYQNASSGSNHEWFYKDVPGMSLHWSQSATSAIQDYLFGKK
jgi:hypothetical protein